ncbi:hypothetical protein EV580_3152 [Mycobacterium sp. BK086]|uniref:hypothetical protein n=1 Tax=Mycobacterium sp. BK086 TaxID=2512165 RepID=UPI001061E8F5|nr:hypothetical protein [Mycobacterium sp. BK086]TDO15012.1 hypothetical protein EV580_3152 [Mycobacterium sp. BK086]
MNTHAVITTTIVLLIVSALFFIGLDRAPARDYAIGAPRPGRPGLYPVIGPATDWRKLWRPVCLYGAILTATADGTAAAAAPIFMQQGQGHPLPPGVPSPCRIAL